MEQLFINGMIYTMAERTASALLINDDTIIGVGSEDEMRKVAAKDAQIYDLGGKCVLPGFQDSHCHLLLTGIQQDSLDLSGSTSLSELIQRGKRFIDKHQIPEGQWIIGRGFNQNLFDQPQLPDRTIADKISKKHPILLDRICGHVGTLNTFGIEQAGITKDTIIAGGKIDLDASKNLNGIFYESALDYVKSLIPKPDVIGMSEILRHAQTYANSLGLTSVHSNDTNSNDIDTFLEAIHLLEEKKELTLRIWEEIHTATKNDLSSFLEKGLRTRDGSDFFQIGNIKFFTDGSLGAHSAFLQNDYADCSGNRGICVYQDDDLDTIVSQAHNAGMQVACHAIGDGAISQCIHAIKQAQNQTNRMDLRHRIVHCQIADDSLLTQMYQSKIASDIQPPFAVTDWEIAEQAFGSRVEDSYRWKTMLDMGIHLGGGSDSPVESLSPIWGIHCAVNRTDANAIPCGGWHPKEKLSVEEAVLLYTKYASYLSFEENKKGTLEPLKLADFVVLSEDIFKIPPEQIKDIQVVMTVVGGKVCYEYK
ncbi:MAG: amidohydrolase [Velocimicrobium sp.]